MEKESDFLGAGVTNMGKENDSPFKPPNDEQVFIQREAEKQKKKEAKETSKHLKIWDKKTSTSRMPLKRIKDEDIPAAISDDSTHNLNAT